MDKLVVKTAVKAVLIILCAVLVAFAVFNLAFPQHMATLWENTGNYAIAVKYTDLRYKYSQDGDDLARCFDDSVLAGDNEIIIRYGNELIAHADFSEICEKKDEIFSNGLYGTLKYKYTVYSEVACAYYRRGFDGDLKKAVEVAAAGTPSTSFEYGNPLMSLAAKIRTGHDVNGAGLMLLALNGEYDFEGVHPTDATEIEYLEIVKEAMRGVITPSQAA